MKYYILPIFFLSLSFGLSAQEETTLPSSGEVIVEEREEYTIPDRRREKNKSTLDLSVNSLFTSPFKRTSSASGWTKGHWAGITLHYNGLVKGLSSLSAPSDAPYLSLETKSIGVALNPFAVTLLHGRRVGLLTGLGFEFNNFRFDQNVTLKRENGITGPDWQYRDKDIKLSKSKLFTCYMNIPLLVEVQLGRRHKCFINAGMIGGMNIGSHTKIKSNSPQFNGTEKSHSNLGLRNFHYGYTVNIGYSSFALSLIYYESGLFRPSEGPRVRQVNVGLSILL